jgi:hypothetical protein
MIGLCRRVAVELVVATAFSSLDVAIIVSCSESPLLGLPLAVTCLVRVSRTLLAATFLKKIEKERK